MSQRKTSASSVELVWEGKAEAALPPIDRTSLRLVERLDPGLLQGGDSQVSLVPWRNRLVEGDNLVAMHALRHDLGGKIDLIYIDPPFATGLSYFSQLDVGKGVRRAAYRDNHARGMAGYLSTLHQRLLAMHQLLSPEGKMFVHCDWRANSAIRLLLDEVFGSDSFRNEIIWRRAPNLGRQAASKQLGRVLDTIYVYSKTPGAPFAGVVPMRSTAVALDRKGKPKGTRWDEERGLYFTTAPRGDYTDKSIAKLRKEGRVFESATGTIYIKYFLRKGTGGCWYKDQPVDALWDDFEVRPLRHRPKREDMGYDTQKPEGLLERIIAWSTKPGDLVADFYSGSGTTAAVAQAMGRRFVACDVGRTAIAVTRRRVLTPADSTVARPFDVFSVRRTALDIWANQCVEQTGKDDAEHILKLFGAKPCGSRAGRLDDAWVWVAPPVTPTGATSIDAAVAHAKEQDETVDKVEILSWEWAAEDAAVVREDVARKFNVHLSMRTIPDDAQHTLTRRRRLTFRSRPELALALESHEEGMRVRLRGLSYPTLDGVPEALRPAEAPWTELIDRWLVDWCYRGVGIVEPWLGHSASGEPAPVVSSTRDLAPGRRVLVKLTTVLGDDIEQLLNSESEV